jgi:beta propeller repeat protein
MWAVEIPISLTRTASLITAVSPSVSGDTVVWRDNRNGNYDIYGYNLNSQTEFLICSSVPESCRPRVSGNIVVWGEGSSIMGYNVAIQKEFFITSPGYSPDISGDNIVSVIATVGWETPGHLVL